VSSPSIYKPLSSIPRIIFFKMLEVMASVEAGEWSSKPAWATSEIHLKNFFLSVICYNNNIWIQLNIKIIISFLPVCVSPWC
jgi:hypothetical protein